MNVPSYMEDSPAHTTQSRLSEPPLRHSDDYGWEFGVLVTGVCARASSLPRVSLRCVCIRKRPRFRTTSISTIISSTVWKYHCLALWYNPYLANCGLPEAKMCFRHFSPTELFNRQHVKVHLNMQGHRWIPKDAPIKKNKKNLDAI